MAVTRDPHHTLVVDAQQRIFNKLCTAFRRSNQDPAFRLHADDLRNELDLSQSIFLEALDGFIDASGERIVTVLDQNGERFISLGETAKNNVSDWEPRLSTTLVSDGVRKR